MLGPKGQQSGAYIMLRAHTFARMGGADRGAAWRRGGGGGNGNGNGNGNGGDNGGGNGGGGCQMTTPSTSARLRRIVGGSALNAYPFALLAERVADLLRTAAALSHRARNAKAWHSLRGSVLC